MSQVQKLIKTLRVTCVSFALLISTLPLAQASTNAEEIDNLLQQQAWMKGVGSETRMIETGPKVMDSVQAFISKPENKDILKTDEGIRLLHEHTRMTNFFMVKRSMDDCKQEGEDVGNRQLRSRITEAARVSENCVKTRKDLASFSTIEQLNEQVQKVTEKIYQDKEKINKNTKGGPSELQDLLFTQSLKNAASTLMDVKYRYEPGFLKVMDDKTQEKKIDENQFTALTRKLCPNSKTCTQEQKNSVLKHIREQAKIIKRDKSKVTYEEARKIINEKVERLQVKLKAVTFETDKGYIRTKLWDSSDANFENEETNKKFGEYVGSYLQEASSSDGNLLLTDTLKENVGGLRLLEDGDLNEETLATETNFTFKDHSLVSNDSLIKKSVEEVKGKITDQIKELGEMSSDKTKQYNELKSRNFKDWGWGADKGEWRKARSENIAKLIRTNPAAVGQILMTNPEYAMIICGMIKDIEKEDKSDASSDKAWMWGGIILGGAIALTGIGAGVGAALIATSAATAATLSVVATGAFVAGVVVGGGEATYWGSRAYSHDKEIRETEQAYFAGSSDTHSIVTARETLTKFKDARFDAALAFGFVLADAGALKVLGAVGKGSAKATSGLLRSTAKPLKPKQVKELSNIYEVALKNKNSKKVLDTIKLLGKDGVNKMDRFFTFLSQTNDATRAGILNKLSDPNMSPEKLKKIINEALEAAEKACLIK